MKSFFSNIRLINSRIFKMSAFVLITSFALGILSSILPLQRFNPEEFNKKAVLNNSSEIISYDKGYFDGEKENNMFFGKVTDEDKQFINDNYKEKYYERKALSIHNTGTYYQCCNGENTKTNTFSSFYSIELQGLNVVDEAYLKEILQIDDIIITNQTKYENGVYITDYFADSMMFFDGYKDYDNLLEQYNTYDIGQLHNYVRIKGIIKTNYKEKMKSILDQVEQGARVAELLQKEENYKYYDYLRLGLNSAYIFDKNISETAEVNSIYVKWVSTPLGNVTYQNYKPIKIKKQNTVLLPYNTIVAAYPLMKKDEIQKILDTTQFEIAFFTDSSNENDIPRFKAKVNIDARENYSKEINKQHIVNYGPLLSDDLFQTFKEQSIYTYSFLFDDKSIYDINASLFDRHIKLNNIYYTYSNTIAAQVSKFNDVFKILNEFCLVLSVCIIIYYAFSIIKDNKYNIGVLKSLGYRGNELSVFFFSSFMIYFAATGCLLGIIFDRMTSLLNKVLIYNLTTRKISTKITSIPIVAFDLKIFLIILISLLTLTLLFSLIYLFILRKFKIIKVIQNKE